MRLSYVYAVLLGFMLCLLLHSPSVAVALLISVTSGVFIYLYSLP